MARRKRIKHLSLAEWRAQLECEADPVYAPMRRALSYQLLAYACGREIVCSCGAVLDVSRALLLETCMGNAVACIECGESAVARLRSSGASVDVLVDGREISDRETAKLARRLG